MSRSIPDRQDNLSKLSLIFQHKGLTVAKLNIGINYESHFIIDCNVPDYIDAYNSYNVRCVSDRGMIDSVNPIEIYCGHDMDLSPVMLLEETEYYLEFESLSDKITEVFPYLSKNGDSVLLKQNCFNGSSYELYFRSYVGKGFFDVVYDREMIQIPFEVRSKKIEYLTDYPQMLSDIAEFSIPFLLEYNSPLYRNYSQSYGGMNTNYEDFIVLEYLFNKLKIMDAYTFVKNHRASDLITHSIERIDGSISNLDLRSMVSMVDGNKLFRSDYGIINGEYNPTTVANLESIDTFDIPENRLIKDLFNALQLSVHGLVCSELYKSSEYIKERLDSMKIDIDDILSDEWLHEVGQLTNIPFESTILQNKNGYRELFQAYQMLGANIAFNQTDLPDLFEGHNKKVHAVYEYWCYTVLFQTLSEMSDNKPLFKNVIERKESSRTEFVITRSNTKFDVSLLYNEIFDQNNSDFRSYSLELKPDFTLLIKIKGMVHIVNFDSKYKIKRLRPKTSAPENNENHIDCWEDDLYKMHTYRDALIRSIGSYILYPGSEIEDDWERYVKPAENVPWEFRDMDILPSIGAIPIRPGINSKKNLRIVINSVFDKLSSINQYHEIIID